MCTEKAAPEGRHVYRNAVCPKNQAPEGAACVNLSTV